MSVFKISVRDQMRQGEALDPAKGRRFNKEMGHQVVGDFTPQGL
jgi:hypothetical protein